MLKFRLVAIAFYALAISAGASAQTPAPEELLRRLQMLEEQVRTLQAELAVLKASAPAPSAETPSPVQPPVGTVAASDGSTQLPMSTTNVFNPNIGMIGNFIGTGGESRGGTETLAPQPSLTLQESEVSVQAIIDPFARADFFLAIGEEGIEVEEGFATFPYVPGGLLVKAGKMRATFGRVNAFHNHSLPWIDRPLVMYNLLGGETDDPDTGIKDAGISVSRLIPAGNLFIEAIGEVYRGDSGTLFQSHGRRDVSVVGHLRGYGDITEASNLEAGFSYARGKNDLGSTFSTDLYGIDLTFRWRPLSRAIYTSLTARTELMWSRHDDINARQDAFGTYASLDYQFRRRWTLGGRYDWSERGRDASVADRGISSLLTFRPSEFSALRGQYRRIRFDDRGVANELLLQLLFTIGAHGAHPF